MADDIIAFTTREWDLSPMAIHRNADGSLVARRRVDGQEAAKTRPPVAHGDRWRHVRSGGEYVRNDDVLDEETGTPCHDYTAASDGRGWLRSVTEWNEIVDGRKRFERI